MSAAMVAGILIGAIAGIAVTALLHEYTWPDTAARPRLRDVATRPAAWAARIGRTQWRLANLPVGGAVFAALAIVSVWPAATDLLAGIAIGAACTAVGLGVGDPLPPIAGDDPPAQWGVRRSHTRTHAPAARSPHDLNAIAEECRGVDQTCPHPQQCARAGRCTWPTGRARPPA